MPPFLDRLSSTQLLVALGLTLWGVWALVNGVVATVAREWRKRHETEARMALMRDLVGRGMAPDEIERIVTLAGDKSRKPRPSRSTEAPGPAEVLVERDEEWLPAVLIRTAEDACLVHVMGEEMSDNSWVGRAHIRFPVSAVGRPVLGGESPAIEAVASMGGDWTPALVLKADDSRFYVHFVGNDDASNAWVDEAEIRFPWGLPSRPNSPPDEGRPMAACGTSSSKSPSVDPEF